MSARYMHSKDHMMPEAPGGVDPVTGARYFGDVLSGRKSVGQALYEAAQAGRYGRPLEAVRAEEWVEQPEPEPEVHTHRGSPASISASVLRKVGGS